MRSSPDACAKSDKELLREFGARIQGLRLDRNLSQGQVAEAAGVGRSTVVRLEGGRGITLLGFVQVLRALDALEDLARFLPEPAVSPLQLLERKGKRRRRASPGHSGTEPAPGADEPRW